MGIRLILAQLELELCNILARLMSIIGMSANLAICLLFSKKDCLNKKNYLAKVDQNQGIDLFPDAVCFFVF